MEKELCICETILHLWNVSKLLVKEPEGLIYDCHEGQVLTNVQVYVSRNICQTGFSCEYFTDQNRK